MEHEYSYFYRGKRITVAPEVTLRLKLERTLKAREQALADIAALKLIDDKKESEDEKK